MKIEKEWFQHAIVRVIFFLLICTTIYKETGIITTILFAIILFENSLNADHFTAVSKLNRVISDRLQELLIFQNEYILPKITNKKDICDNCGEIILSKKECVNCGNIQHADCMGKATDGLLCKTCSEIQEVQQSLERN